VLSSNLDIMGMRSRKRQRVSAGTIGWQLDLDWLMDLARWVGRLVDQTTGDESEQEQNTIHGASGSATHSSYPTVVFGRQPLR